MGKRLVKGNDWSIVGMTFAAQARSQMATNASVSQIQINGVDYVRADSVPAVQPSGSRAVVVVDRGWIFAGDLTRENGRIRLSRALHVFKWESIGFAKMVETAKADLRPIADVDIPEGAEIFCVPVSENWGLK